MQCALAKLEAKLGDLTDAIKDKDNQPTATPAPASATPGGLAAQATPGTHASRAIAPSSVAPGVAQAAGSPMAAAASWVPSWTGVPQARDVLQAHDPWSDRRNDFLKKKQKDQADQSERERGTIQAEKAALESYKALQTAGETFPYIETCAAAATGGESSPPRPPRNDFGKLLENLPNKQPDATPQVNAAGQERQEQSREGRRQGDDRGGDRQPPRRPKGGGGEHKLNKLNNGLVRPRFIQWPR